MPWRRERLPTLVFWPGEFQGLYSPWGRRESDMSNFHFSLSCIGEGNGDPLQYSCLESPRDGGAWWAAVYGVAQSRTRLKRLSSSNVGDLDSISGLGGAPGEGKGYPLHYSGLENATDCYSPWGHKELDMTEQLSVSLKFIRGPAGSSRHCHVGYEH